MGTVKAHQSELQHPEAFDFKDPKPSHEGAAWTSHRANSQSESKLPLASVQSGFSHCSPWTEVSRTSFQKAAVVPERHIWTVTGNISQQAPKLNQKEGFLLVSSPDMKTSACVFSSSCAGTKCVLRTKRTTSRAHGNSIVTTRTSSNFRKSPQNLLKLCSTSVVFKNSRQTQRTFYSAIRTT